MLHATQILLLIAAFLMCPLRCMGALDAAHAQHSQFNAGCCSHGSQSFDDGSRETGSQDAPAEDCGCGNCLCRGAVLADEDSPSFHQHGLSLDPQQAAPPAAGVSAQTAVHIFYLAGLFQLPELSQRCGRSIRIEHQSLLY